jgi:nitrous oxidase accessory protein NosD
MRTLKLFGLSVAFVLWLLTVGNSHDVGLAQNECTITVSSGQSVQQAIDSAVKEAVICVSAGTFTENITISKSLTLQGAGESATILDGNQSGRVITIDPKNESVTIAISGVTVQHGKKTASNDCGCGGGIYNPTILGSISKAKLTVTNATIRENSAEAGGAGIYNGGTLTPL